MMRDIYLEDEMYDIIAVQGVGGFLGIGLFVGYLVYTHANSIVWRLGDYWYRRDLKTAIDTCILYLNYWR